MNVLSVTSVTILLAIFSGVSCQKVPIPHPGLGGSELFTPVQIIVESLVDVQKTVADVVRDVQQILNELSLLRIQQNNRDLQQITLQNGRNIAVAGKAVPHVEPLGPRKLKRSAVVDVDVKDSKHNVRNPIKRSVVDIDVKDLPPPNLPNILKGSLVDVDVKDSKPHLGNIIKRSVVDVDVKDDTPHVKVDSKNPYGNYGSKIGVSA
ncbi:hypothetical protein ANTRET_LOCUS7495 [Anthophora retusa]